MQRKELEAKGLEKETIDFIMDLNGKAVEDAKKTKDTEISELKEQLETAQSTLKDFDGIDPKELEQKVKDLTKSLEDKSQEYESNLAKRDFDSQIDDEARKRGAKNIKAVKSLLNLDALYASKNRDTDMKTAFDACIKDNGYMFGKAEPIKNPVGNTSDDGNGGEHVTLPTIF